MHEDPSLGMEVSRTHHLFWSISHQDEFYQYVYEEKCKGFGYIEILFEAKLVTSGGTLHITLAYSIALFNLKAVVEALERLLFEDLAKENGIEIRPEALLNLINACSSSSSREQQDKALQDKSVALITNKYEKFQIKKETGILERRLNFGLPSWITLDWSFCLLIL